MSSNQYGVGQVPFHIHNQTDSPRVDVNTIKRFPTGISNGQTLYFDGSNWQVLTTGTTGLFLQSLHSWANIFEPFWGTGSLGSFSYSSGTQSLSAANKSIAVFDYTSFSLTGTASLQFGNANDNGTIYIVRSLGDVTITSSASRAIILDGAGGIAGQGVAGQSGGIEVGGNSGNGFGSWYYFSGSVSGGTAGSGVSVTGGGGGGGFSSFTPSVNSTNGFLMPFAVAPGGGGGSGCNDTFNTGIISGAGGRGAGALIILCAGKLNITSSFSATGANGANTTDNNNGAGGGGGGGSFYILYNTLTANTATFTVSKGTGGTASGGPSSCNGGNGTDGVYTVVQNKIF